MLFAYIIVGAMETTPGTMRVEQLTYYSENHSRVQVIHVPTAQYLECWDGQAETTRENTI